MILAADLLLAAERPAGAAAADPDLVHAATTDPDGFLVARRSGKGVGLGAAIVREGVLQVVRLWVAPQERGRGTGRALLAALKAYGRSRRARGVELPVPLDPPALGLAQRSGLPLSTLFLRLEASGGELTGRCAGHVREAGLFPLPSGTALTGWVASLDRETRGFARPADWAAWIARERSHVLAVRVRGHPEAVGIERRTRGRSSLGPIAARTPEAGAEMLTILAARAAAASRRVGLTLPEEARVLHEAAHGLGFRVRSSFALFSDARHGDFRRYAAAGGSIL